MNTPDAEKLNWPILGIIVLGSFMAALDASIVNVALPKMMAIFNSSPQEIQWVLTSYMLTMGIMMCLSGYLGDAFGYKRIYILAMGFFTLGSALCGASWGVSSLVISRVIQALGGGILPPLSMALLYRTFPRSKIGMVMGIWGISAMMAPALGPILGGYLVDTVSWRLIFYINLPIGMINIFLASLVLKETKLIKGTSLDIYGIITCVIGLSALLLGLNQGTDYGWTSPYIISLLFIGAAGITLFVYIELNHPEPIMELRLLKNRVFAIAVTITAALTMGLFGVMFLIPLLLQSVLGETAMKTGLIMFPMALMTGIIMPISGRIYDKFGARNITLLGLILVTIITFSMSRITADTPYSTLSWWLLLIGMGIGMASMPIVTAAMNTVPTHLVGKASGLNMVLKQVSAAFGIAILTTILHNRQVFHYSNIATSVNMNSPDGLAIITYFQNTAANLGFSSDIGSVLGLGIITKIAAALAMIRAIDDCLLFTGSLCLLSAVICLFFKEDRKNRNPAVNK